MSDPMPDPESRPSTWEPGTLADVPYWGRRDVDVDAPEWRWVLLPDGRVVERLAIRLDGPLVYLTVPWLEGEPGEEAVPREGCRFYANWDGLVADRDAVSPAPPVNAPTAPQPDYHYVAMYRDGETLHEYEGAEHVHAFADIDQQRLDRLALVPQRPGLPTPVLLVKHGLRPIFFRRNYIQISMDGTEAAPRRVVTALGWQRTVGKRNVQSFLFLYPDGSLILSDDGQAV